MNANQLRLEDQHAVRRDGANAAGAVGPLGLDGQLPLLAGAHVEQALVPALDHHAFADSEGERLATVVGGVEFYAELLAWSRHIKVARELVAALLQLGTGRTGAISLKRATVVDINLVAGDGLLLAVDLVRHFNVERLVEGVRQRQKGEEGGEEAHFGGVLIVGDELKSGSWFASCPTV